MRRCAGAPSTPPTVAPSTGGVSARCCSQTDQRPTSTRRAADRPGRPMQSVSATRVVRGLESIIDAVAGVLAEQSLDATLQSMARALHGIVPYTSLAIYEVDADRRLLVPVFAEGLFVEETLADPPGLDDSITGKVVRSRQI